MHHRDRFDLNQPLRTNQPANNHERARRRILSVDVLVADFPDLRDLRWVDAIDTIKIELDDVVKIAAGGLRLAFAHTERQSRYDLADVATTAKPVPGGFALSGQKGVVLHGEGADRIIVSAGYMDMALRHYSRATVPIESLPIARMRNVYLAARRHEAGTANRPAQGD